MENKTHYNIVYQTHQGEEWVVASFMFWDEAMEYIEGKKKVLLGHYYKRLRIE